MNILNEEIFLCITDRECLKHAVVNMKRWGCCIRCILRFLGIKNADVYRSCTLPELVAWMVDLCPTADPLTEDRNENCEHANRIVECEPVEVSLKEFSSANGSQHAQQNMDATTENVVRKEPPCISCFGVLQDVFCQSEFVEGIADAVRKLNYEFSTFLCSVSLPVCLVAREHAVLLALAELLPDDISSARRNDISTVKDVWKWINGPVLASSLRVPFDQRSQFEIVLTFAYNKNDEECSFLYKLYPDVFRRRKNNKHGWEVFNRSNVGRAIENTKADVFRRHFYCPPSQPLTYATTIPITCQQGALYIAGRYNKFSRVLSQTPWVVDGKRKSEFSVEELICHPLNKAVLAAEWRFSASGREDVDVRMLGTGRPFVVEFINPRRIIFTAAQLIALQHAINGSTKDIAVRDLQVVSKDETAVLKECEEDKMKRYVALCWSRDRVSDDRLVSLSSLSNITLQQKTPVRVLHRRTLATRERTVYNMSAERVGEEDENRSESSYFAISLSTQAGTYVKEFVHGDLGRTEPSLSTFLGTECDILALDVVAVELDWPKSLQT